jgi:6-pyruvoyltetrahydropterin/6-carboxytetrahydropterin synthase
MYSIKVEGHFSSAHNLKGYKGKCEALHGHNWKVQIEVVGEKLDQTGMLVDFTLLKKSLRQILEKLDHKYLNQIAYFKKANPTSENIAKYIFNLLKPKTPGLKAVTIWESENSQATYEQ